MANRSRATDDQIRVHQLARGLKGEYKEAEKKWKTSQIKKYEWNPRMSWKQLKDWMGWSGADSPTQLKDKDGKIQQSPKEIANIMVKFYKEKVEKIRRDIPGGGTPLSGLEKIMKNRKCVFKLKEVTEDQVKKALHQMRNTCSLGPDGVQADLFKKSAKYALKAICHIVNLSIREGNFALMWKLAKILPLWKGEDKTDPKNYRPISLLCPLSRLVEKLVCIQVMEYLEENNLIHPSIHGYREYHSCVSASIEAYEDAITAQDNGDLFLLSLYDQSAAFNLVDHEIFLAKLKLIGLMKRQ